MIIIYSLIGAVILWIIFGIIGVIFGRITYLGPITKKGAGIFICMKNSVYLISFGPLIAETIISNYLFIRKHKK